MVTARKSAAKIYEMYQDYKRQKDFIGMDMARKFLEMGFTRARRYANHKSGKKYDSTGSILPQETDALTSVKAQSAKIFKEVRDRVATDPEYVKMQKADFYRFFNEHDKRRHTDFLQTFPQMREFWEECKYHAQN